MNRFFNKALFYECTRMDKSLYAMIIGVFICMNIVTFGSMLIGLLPRAEINYESGVYMGSGVMTFVICMALTMGVMFFLVKKQNKLTFLNSIGITRSQILGTKVIAMMSVIVGMLLGTFIIRTVYVIIHIDYLKESVSYIMVRNAIFMVDAILISLTIITLGVISQILFGSVIWSFIIIIFGSAPIFALPKAISLFISPKLKFLKDGFQKVQDVLIYLLNKITSPLSGGDFSSTGIRVVILLIILAIIWIFIFYLNERYQVEDLYNIFLFKFVRVVITGAIAIYLAMTIALCIEVMRVINHAFRGLSYDPTTDARSIIAIVENIICIILVPMTYRFTNYIFNIFEGKSKERKARRILKATR